MPFSPVPHLSPGKLVFENNHLFSYSLMIGKQMIDLQSFCLGSCLLVAVAENFPHFHKDLKGGMHSNLCESEKSFLCKASF